MLDGDVLKVICEQPGHATKFAVSVIATFIVTNDGLVVPVKLPLPDPVQLAKLYPPLGVADIVGVAPTFSQVTVPGETDPVGVVVPPPEGEIIIVNAYCVVQVTASVIGAFIVTENCVVPEVDVEYDPEPPPVIVSTTYRVPVELVPSGPIVTGTTAPEFSHAPDAGEGVP